MATSSQRNHFVLPDDYFALMQYLSGRDGPWRPVTAEGLLHLSPDAMDRMRDVATSKLVPQEIPTITQIPRDFTLLGDIHAAGSDIEAIGDNVQIHGDCLLDRSPVSSIGRSFRCEGHLRLKNCRRLKEASFPDQVFAAKATLTGVDIPRSVCNKFTGEVEIDPPRNLTGIEKYPSLLKPVGYLDRVLGRAMGASDVRRGWQFLRSFSPKSFLGLKKAKREPLPFAKVQQRKGVSEAEVVASARNQGILSAVFYSIGLYCLTMLGLHLVNGSFFPHGIIFLPVLFLFASLGVVKAYQSHQLWKRQFMPFREFRKNLVNFIPQISQTRGSKQ